MDQSAHEIQREREQARAALTDKIELLEERVRDTKRAIRQKFDYRYQAEKRPWKALAISVAAGYLFGRMLGSKPPSRFAPRPALPAARMRTGTLKGAVIGAIVPMLMEAVKTISLRAISSRGSSSPEPRAQSRVLTPFRDEPPHYPATSVPNKAAGEH
jgi:hypothetical protein